MSGRLADGYFDRMYAQSEDPWQLGTRWYEERKYAISVALLPRPRYRHAFEPGCSIGTLTERLLDRCDQVTAIDVAESALRSADHRLWRAGVRERVTLSTSSLDEPWPAGPFDLVVLSEVAYYLNADALAAVLARECPLLPGGATVLAAHWRHPVADYPLSGDCAAEIIAATACLSRVGRYSDADVVIEVFDTGAGDSVAAREGLV